MTSRVELFELETVEDDLFGNSASDGSLELSTAYPKLPSKQSSGKEPSLPSAIREEDQSADSQTGAKDVDDGADKMENDNIQKQLEEPKQEHKQQEPVKEIGNKICEFEVKSDFSERILKSIEIHQECKNLKIKCYENLANKLNVFNQIGIINIVIFGNIVGYESEYISGLK